MEREKENLAKTPIHTVIVDEPIKQETLVVPLPIHELVAEAELWKGLKLVDEYLMALELTVAHMPEFSTWLENANAVRKKTDPLLGLLMEN